MYMYLYLYMCMHMVAYVYMHRYIQGEALGPGFPREPISKQAHAEIANSADTE